MRVTESIEELRQICQQSREGGLYHATWWERNFARKISIYLTKLFLEIGISANQASFIGLIIVIAGGAFLIFPSPKYWFIGIAILGLLWRVLDCVDGEIARYNKTDSPEGAFWDTICDEFALLYMPICISFGIYSSLHSIYPFVFGFLAIMSFSLTDYGNLVVYRVFHVKGSLSEAIGANKPARSEKQPGIIIRYGRFFSQLLILLLALLICSIIDYFISPFAIGSLYFNARYIYFIIFTLLWLVIAIRRIYLRLHGGVRLRV